MGAERFAAVVLCVVQSACVGVTLRERDVLIPAPRAELPPDEPRMRRVRTVVTAADGTVLRGFTFHAPEPKGALVVFYGNGGSVAGQSEGARALARRTGLSVVVVDYRGYGYSDGRAAVRAIRDDGLAVYDHAARAHAGRPLYVLGYSLGSAVAVHAAARRPVAGTILLAPISSVEDVLEAVTQMVPWPAQLFVDVDAEPAIWALRPAPVEDAARLRAPLLVAWGSDDSVSPPWVAERFLEETGAERTSECPIEDGSHSDVSTASERVQECIARFVGAGR